MKEECLKKPTLITGVFLTPGPIMLPDSMPYRAGVKHITLHFTI